MNNWMKDKLISLFKAHAIKHGEFKLSAGGTSKYFIDASKVTLLGDSNWYITQLIWQIEELGTNTAYVGPMSGADPIVGALVFHACVEGYKGMKGGLVRKEPKDGVLIEGCDLQPYDKVVVIDDVVTTGTQALRACKAVEDAGAKVIGVVSVVDRMVGAVENIGSKYRYFPLLTIEDLGLTAEVQGESWLANELQRSMPTA
jgi:orotate phosphoribosyltransferase